MKRLNRWLASLSVGVLSLGTLTAPAARGEDPLGLKSGDRVVLLGSTLFEREQSYGHWETALVAGFPAVDFSLRNLGWSGDTVWAESRAGFGKPEDGFNELKQQLESLKPTLAIVGFGANESFAGPAGRDDFVAGLNRLLDMLKGTGARVVLASPIRQDPASTFGDPARHNRDLATYRDEIERVAGERGLNFVDLLDSIAMAPSENRAGAPPAAYSENGLHLNALGYKLTAPAFAKAMGVAPAATTLEIDAAKKKSRTAGITGLKVGPREIQFQYRPASLPVGSAARGTIKVLGLRQGVWKLTVGGKEVTKATAENWQRGVAAPLADAEQAEALRQAIVRKNELFFYSWRPQNVTYLFGFRKHEQGQNAKEVAEYEPLVAEQEKRIAGLKVPATRQYTLTRGNEKAK